MKRKLVAALACRNQGSRLYGKPIQNLDVTNGIRIIDNIVDCLNAMAPIDEVVLGISEGDENNIYRTIAEEKNLKYIIGDENDVLGRLIQCGQKAEATDIFRITSESPFPYFNKVEQYWQQYCEENAEALLLDNIVDGCGFEILSLSALETSHKDGEDKHRSEYCTLYIRENHQLFNIIKIEAEPHQFRQDIRLTVDNPEDLVVCRAVYENFKDQAPLIELDDIIKFLDYNPDLIKLTAPFTETGYATMFKWGKDE